MAADVFYIFRHIYHSLFPDVKRLTHHVWPLSPHQDTARIHSDDHLIRHMTIVNTQKKGSGTLKWASALQSSLTLCQTPALYLWNCAHHPSHATLHKLRAMKRAVCKIFQMNKQYFSPERWGTLAETEVSHLYGTVRASCSSLLQHLAQNYTARDHELHWKSWCPWMDNPCRR